MKKFGIRFVACSVMMAMVLMSPGATVKADRGYLDESDISITAALDAYIASQIEEETSEEVTAEEAAVAPDSEEAALSKAENETPELPDYTGKALAKVKGNLNVRKDGDESAERIALLPSGACVDVLGTKGDWTKIQSADIVGYVKSSYLLFGEEAAAYAVKNLPKMAVIKTACLKVRAKKSTESTCITMVPIGEQYAILSEGKKWTKIELDEYTSGYVSNDYIEVTYSSGTAISLLDEEDDVVLEDPQEQDDDKKDDNKKDDSKKDDNKKDDNKKDDSKKDDNKKDDSKKDDTKQDDNKKDDNKKDDTKQDEKPSDGKTSSTRKELVNYALQFVGNPYVYGGTSLTEGADCSGFTLAVYKHFGITLPHSATAQSKCGKSIKISEVRKGDLLFYSSNGHRIGHVGIYIGNGRIVHASTRKTGIKVSQYNYKTPVAAASLLD